VKVDHGKVLGPVVIGEDTRFHGMIDGGASVARGVMFDMRGMIAGDLTIESDARVELRGMVAGSVVNRGRLTIYGVVRGPVSDENGGETNYAPTFAGQGRD
jgi:UDP-3-O-[3-hydroxymyristoyl] glucosamine N-acyltransferase